MMGKSSKMSTRTAMITLAGRPPAHGELPRWLSAIAKATGISFRTARSLWNEEITDPNHLAARVVRQQAEIEEARRNAAVVQKFFISRAEELTRLNADLNRGEIDAFLAAARAISGGDSS